jgi:hypothetical protein
MDSYCEQVHWHQHQRQYCWKDDRRFNRPAIRSKPSDIESPKKSMMVQLFIIDSHASSENDTAKV